MRAKAQTKVPGKKKPHPRTDGPALKPWQRYLMDRLTYVAVALIAGMLQGSNQTRKAVEPVIQELRQDVSEAKDDAQVEKDLREYFQRP